MSVPLHRQHGGMYWISMYTRTLASLPFIFQAIYSTDTFTERERTALPVLANESGDISPDEGSVLSILVAGNDSVKEHRASNATDSACCSV